MTRLPPSVVTASVITLFATGTAFDVQSQRSGDQLVYARAGYLLVLGGLVVGVAAVLVLVASLSLLDRRGRAFIGGRRALGGLDLLLVWYAACALVRRGESFVPADVWIVAGSLAAQPVAIVVVVLLLRSEAEPAGDGALR